MLIRAIHTKNVSKAHAIVIMQPDVRSSSILFVVFMSKSESSVFCFSFKRVIHPP